MCKSWVLVVFSSRIFTRMECFKRTVVGIFSRDDIITYRWLIQLIINIGEVNYVRPVLISNKWSTFQTEVPKFSIGILFHSQRRGRLNITDVTDSLYDEELRYMCRVYGRENVIVVIGDLEDTSDEKKASILSGQPSLSQFARDLFLFNEINGDRTPFQEFQNLRMCIKQMARGNLRKKPSYFFISLAILALIFIPILVVCLRSINHTELEQLMLLTNITNASLVG
ncbi:uncharacterized protein [Pyxicephalus adspersus]|uniref:uncharacterized protein n=1 Tax=Pyxicephalus adspersus TaxID=30357 RepID=UPI003B5B00A5